MRSTTHGANSRIEALEKELDELLEAKKVKKDKFSQIVQMLILDYLGIAKNIEDNTKRAEIFAPLIRRDVETTRQYFSKLNNERTPQNLKIVLDYFEKAGLTDKMKLVQKELDGK
jgi:hypothetical protein